jgi:TRAP-type C4-dicarboxylate transport system permease small subunit
LLDRLLSTTERTLNLVAAGAILVIMVLVTTQIVARKLGHALPGIYESAELLMVAIVFLGLAYIQSQHGHVRMELLVTRMPPRLRGVVETFTLFLSLVLFVIITYKSGQNAYQSWQMKDVTMGLIDWPVWPSKTLVPIGSGLLCLRFMVQLLHSVVPRSRAAVELE